MSAFESDRRIDKRYVPDKDTFVSLRSAQSAGHAGRRSVISNISLSGASMAPIDTSQNNTQVVAELTDHTGGDKAQLQARIVWCENDRAGLEFDSADRPTITKFLKSISKKFAIDKALGDVQTCTNCILTANIPGVSFDSLGVCNHCSEFEKHEARQIKTKDYQRLEADMLKKLRTNPKKHPYDCLCLYSGGKDSTYMLYQLVHKYKLRVLAFTFDNYFIAPETFHNMKKVLMKLNVDHILFKPSWEFNKGVFSAGFKHADKLESSRELAFMIGHACWPCFTQISMHSIKLAMDKNIPNVIVGTTPGQIRQKKYDLVSKYNGLADVYRNMVLPMVKLLGAIGRNDLKSQLSMPISKQLKALSMRLIPFFEHVHYNEKVVLETVRRELGWESPKSTDSCSTNCHLNSLGIQVHQDKYGVSPYVIPLARDVREGLVDREEALAAVAGDLNEGLVEHIAKQFDVEFGAGAPANV